jgi:hypothetical protein
MGYLGTILSFTSSGTTAFAINDAGHIAGVNQSNAAQLAVLWTAPNEITQLGPGAGWPMPINNGDQIVGYSPSLVINPFLWTAANGLIRLSSSIHLSTAVAINDRAQIAGSDDGRAALWEVVSQVDTTPPVVDVPESLTLEATGPDGAATLTGPSLAPSV